MKQITVGITFGLFLWASSLSHASFVQEKENFSPKKASQGSLKASQKFINELKKIQAQYPPAEWERIKKLYQNPDYNQDRTALSPWPLYFEMAKQAKALQEKSLTESYRQAAEQGDFKAQRALGLTYMYGYGEIKKDEETAQKWLFKAALHGDLVAQCSLAALCARHSSQNFDIVSVCRQLAEEGDPKFQYILATMYASGGKVERDHQKALTWYHQAAQEGYGPAQCAITIMYSNGKVNQYQLARFYEEQGNSDAAAQWYKISADQEYPPAWYKYIDFYAQGYYAKNEKVMNWCLRFAPGSGDLSAIARRLLEEMNRNGREEVETNPQARKIVSSFRGS